MKYLDLTQGKRAIVDDEDYPLLSRFAWQYQMKDGCEGVYVEIRGAAQKRFKIMLHQMITPAAFGKYLHHKNKNVLDNRKENLVLLSNNHKRHLGEKRKIGSSKYKGVSFIKSANAYRATIKNPETRKTIILLQSKSEVECAKAYNKKAVELYGEYCYQNKIDES